MSYSDLVSADLRLCILRVLHEDVDYAHNEAVLQSALALIGHNISADRLRTELRWLEEQLLITIVDVANTVWVAKLTNRGEDAALGRARAPGVARPRPGM